MSTILGDPCEFMDSAIANGCARVEFADEAEARQYYNRVRGAKARAQLHNRQLDHTTKMAYRGIYLRREGNVVQAVDTAHPDAAHYLPQYEYYTPSAPADAAEGEPL